MGCDVHPYVYARLIGRSVHMERKLIFLAVRAVMFGYSPSPSLAFDINDDYVGI